MSTKDRGYEGNKENLASANPEVKRRKSVEIRDSMLDWWVGTVVFSYFPIALTGFFCFLQSASIDIQRILGDGELILASFAISTPSVVRQFNCRDVAVRSKGLFYLSLLAAFFQLAAYVNIKTTVNNVPWTVYTSTLFCALSSVFSSFLSEKSLVGGGIGG